jgi:hypothetical protein
MVTYRHLLGPHERREPGPKVAGSNPGPRYEVGLGV